jgi:hypothetical protein
MSANAKMSRGELWVFQKASRQKGYFALIETEIAASINRRFNAPTATSIPALTTTRPVVWSALGISLRECR